jgi:hypothetical protein
MIIENGSRVFQSRLCRHRHETSQARGLGRCRSGRHDIRLHSRRRALPARMTKCAWRTSNFASKLHMVDRAGGTRFVRACCFSLSHSLSPNRSSSHHAKRKNDARFFPRYSRRRREQPQREDLFDDVIAVTAAAAVCGWSPARNERNDRRSPASRHGRDQHPQHAVAATAAGPVRADVKPRAREEPIRAAGASATASPMSAPSAPNTSSSISRRCRALYVCSSVHHRPPPPPPPPRHPCRLWKQPRISDRPGAFRCRDVTCGGGSDVD